MFYNKLVASVSADQSVKDNADYVCTGFNDHVKINDAISSLAGNGGGVALTEGNYDIRDSIYTREKTALLMQPASNLLVYTNVHGINMARYSQVHGGRMQHMNINDKASIYLNCDPTVYAHTGYLTLVEKMFLQSGHKGVFLDLTSPNYCFATGVRFRDLYIYGGQDSIRIESAPGNWANSNYFDNIYARGSQYGIRSIGDNNENVYSGFVFQAHPSSIRAVYTEGMDRFVACKVWDWYQTGQPFAVECKHPSGPAKLDFGFPTDIDGKRAMRTMATNTGIIKKGAVTRNVSTTSVVGAEILPEPQIAISGVNGQSVQLVANVRLKSVGGGAPAIQVQRKIASDPDWSTSVQVGRAIYGTIVTPGEFQTLQAFVVDKPASSDYVYGISWGNIQGGTDEIIAWDRERDLTALALYI